MRNTVKLFMYGSLKRAEYNFGRFGAGTQRVLQTKVETAKNYRLFDAGYYPVLVQTELGQGAAIKGEVHEVNLETLMQFDKMELGAGYLRLPVKLKGRRGPHDLIFAYLYQEGISRYPEILSGEWVKSLAAV